MSQILFNLSIIFSQPTGISNYAKNLFPYLKTLKPTLLTAQEYPDFNCYPIPHNLTPAQGTKGHFNRLVWTQFELPRIYEKLKSQLIFSPIPEAPLSANCRYIVMVHDLIPLRFPKLLSPLTHFSRFYVPQVLAQAQHIICNSHATAKDITDFYQIRANKITPIPLAYDANHFRPLHLNNGGQDFPFQGRCANGVSALRQSSLRQAQCKAGKAQSNAAPPAKVPYFLYLGRQDPYKNLHRLITAFAALSNHQDYELWLAGPQDKRFTPALKTQVDELGISDKVKFLNYVSYSELPKIICDATALVFPSLWEGFGFPVLEAMACGTPVITSNLSSLPEVAGDAALLINPYNVEEITEAMQTIATNSVLRQHLSTQSMSRASQFSWEKTGLATVEVLSGYL